MKYCLFILVFICCSILCFGQRFEMETKLKEDIEKSAEKLMKDLMKDLDKGEIEHEIYVELEVDFFKIDEFIRKLVDKNPSSTLYISLLVEAEAEYQKLLTKYYDILLAKLSQEDAALLRLSQESWKEWLDNERNLNSVLNDSRYNPEVEQYEMSAEKHLSYTKNRVIDMADYIARIYTDD